MKNNIQTLIDELKKKYGFVDSSLLNACSCRVHDNPLFADCVDDAGKLHSDLEYALNHDTSQSAVALVQNVREVVSNQSSFDMPAGQRHISLANVMDVLGAHDVEDVQHDLKDKVKAAKQAKSSQISFDADKQQSQN